ncbi:MAG TPA: hypothetical protein VFM37_12100 [Pseudonocardiaceae bacterium]|nr:hypothetical protein [Pseudonocardiaceae bacterium]
MPAAGYRLGQVLRATLSEHEHPVPAGAPGYHREGDQRVSAIVTVLAELAPQYARDEDGDQAINGLPVAIMDRARIEALNSKT